MHPDREQAKGTQSQSANDSQDLYPTPCTLGIKVD